MREKLKALAELQKVDLEAAALRKAADVYPKQIGELEKELSASRAQVEAERGRLLELERQKVSLEQNISEDKEKVKKWESRLTEQRSTREYAALAREIDIAKKANLSLAEELAGLTSQLNAQREAVKTKEQEHAARQDQVGGKVAELRGKASEADGQLKSMEGRRGKAAASVDPTLARRYDLVRKKRMPALVEVQAPGTCLGCNMNVPPQLYNTLRSTLGTDVCPSCHRIIYASEALEEQPAK